jgi:hypothetical protein
MRSTRASRQQPNGFLGETEDLPRRSLHPNTWNVNRLNAFTYAKLIESITEFGFIDPILARACPYHADYEIIGGKHRWDAAGDLGIDVLPVILVVVDDARARRLSIIDNELHGQADPVALGSMLKELLDDLGPEELLRGLPYTEDILEGFLGFNPLPPLPAAPAPAGSPPGSSGSAAERWVERTYRMPMSVAEVLDDALAKARDGDRIDDWQALERVAAEFLAS